MRRLRLLKVICQPVFVVDDGENLEEQVMEPVAVSAADWPGYANGQFKDAYEALRASVEQETPTEDVS